MSIDTYKKALDLRVQLERSLRIRSVFNLPREGIIKVFHVKPSGAAMDEERRHITRICNEYGETLLELTKTEYIEKMKD